MVKKLLSTFRMMGRVLKNLILRPFRTACSRIKNLFSAGRLVSAMPGAAKNLPAVLKSKPEKREDYFDWGSIYVAKSLVAVVVVLLIALPLIYIFLLHPLFTSWWWVRDFVVGDTDLSSYSGKVAVYYDSEHKQPQFIGRLHDGLATEQGEEYYENGKYKYIGNYASGVYEGEGILYREDGSVTYRGGFSAGRYSGIGELTDENGDVYSGTFESGKLNGSGTLAVGSSLYYDGSFADGRIEGEGKILYADGTVRYAGSFTDGLLNGSALEYYPDGTIKYNGFFTGGAYNGNGVLYSEAGKKLYSGGFDMGQYSGSGTLYDDSGAKLYTGEFEEGVYSGSGTLYGADGSVTTGSFSDGQIVGAAERVFLNGRRYDGTFSDNLMNGTGTLSDVTGRFTYSGSFLDDDFDYRDIFSADTNTIKAMIPSLTQTIEDDYFYLTDSGFGIAVKCSFADGNSPAAAVEIFTLPISGTQTEIHSAGDINAPQASAVAQMDNTYLPQWAARQFGIAYNSVRCYAARYSDMTVYFWVDSSTSRLVLRSAVPGAQSGISSDTPPEITGGDTETGLSSEEIAALFDELGLDPADFASLGFDFGEEN